MLLPRLGSLQVFSVLMKELLHCLNKKAIGKITKGFLKYIGWFYYILITGTFQILPFSIAVSFSNPGFSSNANMFFL